MGFFKCGATGTVTVAGQRRKVKCTFPRHPKNKKHSWQ